MKFQGGVKEAAKLLAGLSKSARDKVLEIISKKDPHMADTLNQNLYSFEDLKLLTPVMVIELLRSIKIPDMGLALKTASPELKDHILKNTPRVMRQEMEEILLGPPKLLSHVEEAQDRIMKIVREKIDKGQLVLDQNKNDTLV
jgi:flagellar motor switch protein FliG